jgi:hypothetical protein
MNDINVEDFSKEDVEHLLATISLQDGVIAELKELNSIREDTISLKDGLIKDLEDINSLRKKMSLINEAIIEDNLAVISSLAEKIKSLELNKTEATAA